MISMRNDNEGGEGEIDVTTFGYPVGSSGSTNKGYWKCLDEDQERALVAVQRWAVDNGISRMSRYALHPSLTFLRYLRANSFDVEKTTQHLQRNSSWRKTMCVDKLAADNPELALGCSLSQLTAIFPHWHFGYDLTGRPVMYKKYTLFDAAAIQRIANLDSIMKYHIWEQESCMRLCMEQSLKTGYIVETTTTILDLKNMRLAQVTQDFLSFMKTIGEVDSKQYPETLGKMFIINAPSAFPFVWRMVRIWLDPGVASKIQVMSGEREWFPVLSECIGLDNLPSDYGGKACDLSSLSHPYADSMELLRQDAVKKAGGTNRVTTTTHGPSSTEAERWLSLASISRDSAIPDDESNLSDFHFVDANEPPSPVERLEVTTRNNLNWMGWDEEMAYLRNLKSTSALTRNFGDDEVGYLGTIPEEGTSQESLKVSRLSWKKRLGCWDPIWVFDYALRNVSSTTLRKLLGYSLLTHGCLATAMLILAAYAITTSNWISIIYQVQLWTGVVMILVSTAMLTINFGGFLGWWQQNKPLLIMYGFSLAIGAVLFLAIAVASFLYSTNAEIAGYGDAALQAAIPDEGSRTKAKQLLNQYYMILAVSSLLAFLFTTIPMVLAFVSARRFSYQINTLNQQQQLRTVLKVSQAISTITALCMLTYGAKCLDYLFSIHFEPTIFPMFGLVYGGILTLIMAAVGTWVSATVHRVVVQFYAHFGIPLLIAVLIVAAAVSLGAIPGSNVVVSNHFSGLLLPRGSANADGIILVIQTQLLVGGVLSIFACVFQITSLLTSRRLCRLMTRIEQGTSSQQLETSSPAESQPLSSLSLADVIRRNFSTLPMRTIEDRALITWAVIMGLYHIFFDGTYLVLAYCFARSKDATETWAEMAWKKFSLADERYIQGDPFLIASDAVHVVLTGPLLLVYAWATFVRAPFRHLCGIVASILIMHSTVLFYAEEIDKGNKDLHPERGPELAGVVVSGLFFLFIAPGLVLLKELANSSGSTSRADTYELIIGVDMDTAQNLSRAGGSVSGDSTHSHSLALVGRGGGGTPAKEGEGSDDKPVTADLRLRPMSIGAAVSLQEQSVLLNSPSVGRTRTATQSSSQLDPLEGTSLRSAMNRPRSSSSLAMMV